MRRILTLEHSVFLAANIKQSAEKKPVFGGRNWAIPVYKNFNALLTC